MKAKAKAGHPKHIVKVWSADRELTGKEGSQANSTPRTPVEQHAS